VGSGTGRDIGSFGGANIVQSRCYYVLQVDNETPVMVELPPGHYKRMRMLFDRMHQAQDDALPGTPVSAKLWVAFEFVGNSRKVRMNFNLDDFINRPKRLSLKFSPDLALILGFDPDKTYTDGATARVEPTLIAGDVHSMYVYCDLAEHVTVGDTKAPLLRIVDKYKRVYGNVHQVLNPVLRVPLLIKCFDTVEIKIMTDTGAPVPFRFGKAFVVLEFRRRVHPYLAL